MFDTRTLNTKDEKGRLHGFWIRYLDAELKPCKKKKAYFYGYEIHDHGRRVQKFYYPRFKRRGVLTANVDGDTTSKPILLAGTFEWRKKNGKLISREIYTGGRPLFIQSFKFSRKHPDEILFSEHLYYDILYSGKVGTFYYEEHSKGIITFKGFFRKRERGWRVYKNPVSNPKYNTRNN